MVGGTFTTQNKVRPGVYINFNSQFGTLGEAGERGIAAMPLALSWGQSGKVISVEAGESTFEKFGYPINSSEMLLIREALKRAATLLVYRLNEGIKASATLGNLIITARYGGVKGNSIKVAVVENIDDGNLFEVSTLVDDTRVEVQTVSDISGLVSNAWVVFTGEGTLTESAGVPLEGGSDGTVTNQNYMDYLAAVEVLDFNTMALPSTDPTLKGTFAAFCRRLREEEGKKIQVVLENYPSADYEGVISIKNGVVLQDGTTLTAAQCTAWVAGATAGAEVNESLTYSAYDDSADASPRYTNTQVISALKAGEFVFTSGEGKAVVEQDINTLTGFTPDKGKAFGKNRVIRVLDGIGKDFMNIFSSYYIGKVNNNVNGRELLKSECINYLKSLQEIEAIQNFDSQTDISVNEGTDADNVYIETYIQPTDSVEKIYMKVQVV